MKYHLYHLYFHFLQLLSIQNIAFDSSPLSITSYCCHKQTSRSEKGEQENSRCLLSHSPICLSHNDCPAFVILVLVLLSIGIPSTTVSIFIIVTFQMFYSSAFQFQFHFSNDFLTKGVAPTSPSSASVTIDDGNQSTASIRCFCGRISRTRVVDKYEKDFCSVTGRFITEAVGRGGVFGEEAVGGGLLNVRKGIQF